MTRIQRYKFLQMFGDALPHSWYEVIFLGCQHLKMHQYVFEAKIFKRALTDGIIQRVESKESQIMHVAMAEHDSGFFVGPAWQQYDYKITAKGDECLRNEQISRDGDYTYYKKYDRTVHGQYGVDHFAPLPNGLSHS